MLYSFFVRLRKDITFGTSRKLKEDAFIRLTVMPLRGVLEAVFFGFLATFADETFFVVTTIAAEINKTTAFVYGYGGMFAAGNMSLANLYPITASMGLIQYRSHDVAVHEVNYTSGRFRLLDFGVVDL